MNKQMAIVIGLVVDSDKNILIAKRVDRLFPEADGKWEFVGGKIEFGEDPETAVVREVREETGLETAVVRMLPRALTNLWTDVNGEQVQVIILSYECAIVGGALHEKISDPKIAELRFIHPTQLKNYDVMKNVHEIASLLNQ